MIVAVTVHVGHVVELDLNLQEVVVAPFVTNATTNAIHHATAHTIVIAKAAVTWIAPSVACISIIGIAAIGISAPIGCIEVGVVVAGECFLYKGISTPMFIEPIAEHGIDACSGIVVENWGRFSMIRFL